MANSADPDQLASEADPDSVGFYTVKAEYIRVQQDKV